MSQMSNLSTSEPNDLVPYRTSDGLTLYSPSPYWRIRSAEPSLRVGRQSSTRVRVLRVVFEHVRENGDKIVVETEVAEKYELSRLEAFLDASMELPGGIRVSIGTMESVPWDNVVKPPITWTRDLE